MASALSGARLIRIRQPKEGAMKPATMTTKLVALALLCLMTGTAVAQQPNIASLMSKALAENPGEEVLMITVEYAPGGSDPIHRRVIHHALGDCRARHGEP
jgi:TRAP-type C4-dicarboxylate transport system permease large subunit